MLPPESTDSLLTSKEMEPMIAVAAKDAGLSVAQVKVSVYGLGFDINLFDGTAFI